MDPEILISYVYERRPLWDRRDKGHSNRHTIERCWKEISSEMGYDEHLLRKKWKYMRDQFAVELGKITPSRLGDAGDNSLRPKWPYFELLLFLKDIVKARPSNKNLSINAQSEDPIAASTSTEEDDTLHHIRYQNSFTESNTTSPYHDDELIGDDYGVEFSENTDRSNSYNHGNKKRKHPPINSFNMALLEIEKKKLEYLEEKSAINQNKDIEDEDLFFFKSILPHVKKIPESKKLSFRNRVHELVEKFAYNQDSTITHSVL